MIYRVQFYDENGVYACVFYTSKRESQKALREWIKALKKEATESGENLQCDSDKEGATINRMDGAQISAVHTFATPTTQRGWMALLNESAYSSALHG